MAASPTIAFDVRGQKGAHPALGLGTATLFGAECTAAVRAAIRAGYRLVDTALLYNNQEAVGLAIREAIAAGDVTREELFVTSKCAFYPAAADGANTTVHIRFHANNKKGEAETAAAVDECLALLGLEYVDLMLIHNPCTGIADYQASSSPHCFELAKALGPNGMTEAERALVMQHRLAAANAVYDEPAAEAARAASWRALEAARAAGKCKFIGVSNYSPHLLRAMDKYATVQPACNQLELHPRFSSPALRAMVKGELKLALTAYGTGNSVAIEKSPVVAAIAARRGISPVAVVIMWTLQHGVAVIPRTATLSKMEENARSAAAAVAAPLDAADMAALDALNQAHPYYWSPMPLLPPGAKPDC